MSKSFYDKTFRIGILGGGQLGRMLIQEGINLNLNIDILDPAADAPCSKIANNFTVGSLTDYDSVYNFGKGKDLVTIEIENVNVEALKKLEEEGVKVYPSPSIIEIIKDKGLQKAFYKENNIPTSDFILTKDRNEAKDNAEFLPVAHKLRTGGYDGKGVSILRTEADINASFDAPAVMEKLVDFEKEISVIVARNANGETKTFPTVEMEFDPKANLVEFLFSPAKISSTLEIKAQEIAKKVAEAFNLIGILAVELFITKDGGILVNEAAPRPHNSGHQTIEGNVTSQYEQHLRAILNVPLGDTSITQPSVMVNLLGEENYTGNVIYAGLEECLKKEGLYIHLYGKTTTKPYRKMGHITIVDETIEKAKEKANFVKQNLKSIA